jgi:hypothetical protein
MSWRHWAGCLTSRFTPSSLARPTDWGLRDYGTGQWEGGSAECDHLAPLGGGFDSSGLANYENGLNGTTIADKVKQRQKQYADICGKCGARRIDAQIGLESTPEEYVSRMVEVFRAVRRVLRKDGTCFVNLGDSYASGVTGHGLSCGICGIGLADCPGHDLTSTHLCDACQAELFRRTLRNNFLPQLSLDGDSRGPSREHRESALDHLPMMDSSALKQTPLSSSAIQDRLPSVVPEGEQLPASQESMRTESSFESSDRASIRSPLEGDREADPTSIFCEPHPERMDQSTTDKEGMLSSFASRISGTNHNGDHVCPYRHYTIASLKNKDLVGIPWRVAFALQADGWYLRSDIIWSKPNPMPESVTDRPTKSHEYLFLLSKSPQYFYDAEAIREGIAEATVKDRVDTGRFRPDRGYPGAVDHGNGRLGENPGGKRNRRTVWTIATEPYPEAHFATFPRKLVQPCILAGCPEHACPKCGAPWVKEVEPTPEYAEALKKTTESWYQRKDDPFAGTGKKQGKNIWTTAHYVTIDHGEHPTCTCGLPAIGGTCLDPFGGSGTTAEVALEYGRRAILIELKPEYVELQKRRLAPVAGRPLLDFAGGAS